MTDTKDTTTTAALEALAVADYKAASGRLFRVQTINGYGGYPESPDDSGEFALGNPAIVRVHAGNLDHQADRDDVLHWNDEWLDPIWQVDVISGLPEELKGMYSRFTWVDGIASYNRLTGEKVDYSRNFEPLTWYETAWVWLANRILSR